MGTKTPKKPQKAAKKAADKIAEEVEDLTKKASRMAVSKKEKFKPFDMSIKCPFMVKSFLHDARETCQVDIWVPTLSLKQIRFVCTGDTLVMSLTVPAFFGEYERVLVANTAVPGFSINSSIATEHLAVVKQIRAKYGRTPLIGEEPQVITLPFLCEEQIVTKDSQLFDGDEHVSNGTGHAQFFSVVTITLHSVQKSINEDEGQFRMIGSPVLADHMRAAGIPPQAPPSNGWQAHHAGQGQQQNNNINNNNP